MIAYPRVRIHSNCGTRDGYSEALLVSRQRRERVIEVIPERVPIWRPVIRVSPTIVKRKRETA